MNTYLEKLGIFAVGIGAGVLISQYYTKSPKLLKWYLGKDNLPSVTNWKTVVENLSKQVSFDENNLAIAIKALTGHTKIKEMYELLQSAYSRNPDNLVVAENFALVNISMSDVARDGNDLVKSKIYFQEAKKIFEKLPEKSLSPSTLLAIGYSLQKSFSFDSNPDLLIQAIAAYKKAILNDKKNKVLFCLLGECYMQQVTEKVVNDSSLAMAEAIVSLQNAIAIDESYGLAHFRLAKAYESIDELMLANQHMSKSLEIFRSTGPSGFPKEFQGNDAESLFEIKKEQNSLCI